MEKEIKRYKYQIISSDILKIIAVVTMLIDHIGAGILEYSILYYQAPFGLKRTQVLTLYTVFRIIGRTAFPIFCFLLVEGFMHTRNRFKYLRNLCVFALISEIPFDLSVIDNSLTDFINPVAYIRELITEYQIDGSIYIFNYQNVYFTLAIGLITIWIMDNFWSKVVPGYDVELYGKLRAFAVLGSVIATAFGCAVAELLCTDYGAHGVILIAIFYLFRSLPVIPQVAGYLSMFSLFLEPYSVASYVLTALYNGKRSLILKKMKYFFYIFYPAHLLIIYIVRCILY